METDETLQKMKDFLNLFYMKEAGDCEINQDINYLNIDFLKIMTFDIDLAQELLDNFEESIKLFEIALSTIANRSKSDIRVRICNLATTDIDIWKLRAKDVDKVITIKGFVRRVGDVQHKVYKGVFECPSCGGKINILMRDDKLSSPSMCACGRKGNFRLVSKTLQDIQKILIEEDPATISPTQKPRSILCLLRNDLTRELIDKYLQPSKKVIVMGVVKDIQLKIVNEFKKYIEVNNIKIADDSINSIQFTQEEIEQFKKVAESKTLFEDLAQSIIPNVQGHANAKIAVLLQLMGGVPLYIDNHLEERGQIHILLVGPPGQGKTLFLKRAILFLAGSRFTSGRGSSGVGLIAAVTKDEEMGGYVLDSGAVPMASGAMISIDELDKINRADIGFLNSAMIDMKIIIDKANIHSCLITETSILAAANPKNRIFDSREPIWKQIGLPKDLLDRFDLIFPIESGKNEEEKKKVANLVVGKYRQQSEYGKPTYSKDFMTKYIAYAKKNFNPEMSEEIQEYIVENFINIIKPADKEEDAAYFSYRLLTNIIRLTQAIARTKLSNTITSEDAQQAVNLLISSLKLQGIITATGLFDYERAEAIVPKAKRDKMMVLKQIIRDLQSASKNNLADYDTILLVSREKLDINEDRLDELLGKMRNNGDVFEPRKRMYQLI